MAKKSSKSKERSALQSLAITIIGAVVIAAAAFFGVDLSELLDDTSATAAPTVPTVPTLPTAPTQVAVVPGGDVAPISLQQGFAAQRGGLWSVFFTAPTGSSDESTYFGSYDEILVDLIDGTQNTLDIAAFEWNRPNLTQAVIRAHNRGVRVRMAVDDEHVLEDDESTIQQVIDAGIPVRDDSRSDLMHHKFMIFDGVRVWTGSTNFTRNGFYRNNNNSILLTARRAVLAYQAEFDEMFIDGEFGSRRSTDDSVSFTHEGIDVQVVFAPEDEVVPAIVGTIESADSHIRFMNFAFTLDEVGDALLAEIGDGVIVEGIFDSLQATTRFSEMSRLFCAGADMRIDGGSYILHHKVFIIDDHTVLTGSFNISVSATEDNDENMIIIRDPLLAAQFIAEFERLQAIARTPDPEDVSCN